MLLTELQTSFQRRQSSHEHPVPEAYTDSGRQISVGLFNV